MKTLKLLKNTGNTKIYLQDSYNFGNQVYIYKTLIGKVSIKQSKIHRNGWYIDFLINCYGAGEYYASHEDALTKIIKMCDTEFERIQEYLI